MDRERASAPFLHRLRCLLLLTLALAAAVAMVTSAQAHYLSQDSVHDGRICWSDDTGFDDARRFGINRWEELSGGVNLKRADSNCRHLKLEDYRDPNSTTRGFWQPRNDEADLIGFNRARLEPSSTYNKRSTATHELGHAHRLAHSFKPNVMNAFCCDRKNRPQEHDKSDYKGIW